MTRTETEHGFITTFEHASHEVNPQKLGEGDRKLVIVWFDGEPDLWTVPCPGPDDESASKYSAALCEIKEYYKIDWDGTGREFPMLVFAISETLSF